MIPRVGVVMSTRAIKSADTASIPAPYVQYPPTLGSACGSNIPMTLSYVAHQFLPVDTSQLNCPQKWVKCGQTSLLICGPKNGHTCPVELKDGRISNQFSALEGPAYGLQLISE